MSQERARLSVKGAMFNCGVGVVCKVQMPPLTTIPPLTKATAVIFPPSDDTATVCQFNLGKVFEIQEPPELVDV